MRWILGVIGALLGALVAEGEGLFLGLLGGLLIGWIIERERAKTRFAQRANAVHEPDTSALLAQLSRRVAELERAVSALQAQRAERPERAAGHAPREAESSTTAAPTREDARELADVASAAVDSAAAESALASPPYAEHALDERVDALGEARAEDATTAAAAQASLAAQAAQQPATTAPAAQASLAAQEAATTAPARPTAARANAPAAQQHDAVTRALEALRAFAFGGNTVVRVGVLVLTVGLGLLAKYAADHAYLPLELRLAFAAAMGVGLIVLGYRLREGRAGFATALQGGGVAALYLVTFFSYYAYQLLPAPLTLSVLVALAALSSLLAVVQNAQQLAVFGAIGGFLAPVLASRGGGSHVALFSYYALLNAALVGIALFRAWRVLNWTGFLFTFGVASLWGALKYEPEHMPSASAFLALFFVFYLLDGTLFSWRLPAERRGAIDTTLTFGTPLATLGLAAGLFRTTPLYLALACALMAALYLAVAAWLLSRRDEAMRTLSQAYVAIGIGVATLAIPFALENALGTALAWSVEASGLVWVGAKQLRLRTRVAGYLLFGLALCALLLRFELASQQGRALFCALIALALAFAAACIERRRDALYEPERYVGHALLALATLSWLAALHACAAAPFVPQELHDLALLALIAASVFGFELAGTRSMFRGVRMLARFALPYVLISVPSALSGSDHPFAGFAWLGWIALFLASYSVWHRQEADASTPLRPALIDALHASAGWLFALLSAVELNYLAENVLPLAEGWVYGISIAAPLPLALLALAGKPRWPFAAHARAYVKWSAWPITWIACSAALMLQADTSASSAPLPYLPLLNPLDLAHALALGALLLLARHDALDTRWARTSARWAAAASLFVLLNGDVVHTAYHWADVPLEPWQLPSSPLVQSAFSILWTAIALVAMVVAHRGALRGVWVTGAVLLGAVVVKLFLLDLAQLSSVAKIVTFLAVGVLLLLVGYFAPVPPADAAQEKPA